MIKVTETETDRERERGEREKGNKKNNRETNRNVTEGNSEIQAMIAAGRVLKLKKIKNYQQQSAYGWWLAETNLNGKSLKWARNRKEKKKSQFQTGCENLKTRSRSATHENYNIKWPEREA